MFKKTLSAIAAGFFAIAAPAKGPIGIGRLEIGMTPQAIEALTAADGAHLATPMTPYAYRGAPRNPGEDKFEAQVLTPLHDQPIYAVLTFSGGALKSMFLTFGESPELLERAKDLITSKYGEAAVKNSRKEEQCIYRNGANFKVSSGPITYKWTQERDAQASISTTLSDVVINVCPSNLRYGGGAIKSMGMSIGVDDKPKNVANPF